MRVAIIDLGTNTFNLLVAEIKNKKFKELYGTKLPVKLGEGGINKHYITPAAFDRGLKAVGKYKKIINRYKVSKILAFATSAIREASNGEIFTKEVESLTGISASIISGNKEAELIYEGIRQAVKMTNERSLIMDIGGGSTEFIIADKNRIVWKKSFLLGAARLIEKFNPSDPIKETELKKIETYLTRELKPLFNAIKKHPVTELIGSSGSFESLADMIAWKFYTPKILNEKTEYTFNLRECNEIYKIILKSKRSQRLKTKGLIKMRVDMIVVSSIFVNLIIEKLSIKKMRLSTYSLKEGAIAQLI